MNDPYVCEPFAWTSCECGDSMILHNVGQWTFTLDIPACPRCGEDHQDLEMAGLKNSEPRTLWTICPNVGQPVLVRLSLIPVSDEALGTKFTESTKRSVVAALEALLPAAQRWLTEANGGRYPMNMPEIEQAAAALAEAKKGMPHE